MPLLIDTAGLKVSLEPGTPPASLDLVVEASPDATLGFSIFRLIPSGPQMMLGTNLSFNNEGVARIPLFDTLPTGLYVVVTGPAPTDNRLSFPNFVPPPGGHTFWLGDGRPRISTRPSSPHSKSTTPSQIASSGQPATGGQISRSSTSCSMGAY